MTTYKKESIVIYTSIFGDSDGLLPQPKIPEVDYYCFSDKPIKAFPWKVIIVEPKFNDPVRSAKEYKILPHVYFPQYQYSIWIDGNYLVEDNIPELINFSLCKYNMAAFNHNKTKGDARDCIYDEFAAIIKLGEQNGYYKDSPEIMQKQINRYLKEGYPPHNGLIFGSILIRRHNEHDVINTMELWWKEILAGSRRDQLSFNYIVWKTGLKFLYLDCNVRDNKWFYQIGSHRADYRLKIFRYKIKKLFGIKRHY